MATMTAAFVRELGPADTIEVGPFPAPSAGPDEVLVAVEHVAVDPVDTYVRSGKYVTTVPLPLIVGRDLVGRVVAPGSTDFEVDEPVWCNSLGHDGRQGSFADLAVVPAGRLYRLPAGVDPLTAVAVAHPAATAYLGWFVHAGLRPGDCVYVGGAAGNVGTAAVQMAAFGGARVIASARPQDHESCRLAGADVVLDYRDPQLAERLRAAAPAGVDVYWETSGHHDFELVAQVVAPGGTVLVTAAADPLSSVAWARLYTRDVSVRGFVISRAAGSDLADAAHVINTMLQQDRLTTRIADHLPLSLTAQAHARIERGEVSGRLVLSP